MIKYPSGIQKILDEIDPFDREPDAAMVTSKDEDRLIRMEKEISVLLSMNSDNMRRLLAIAILHGG